MKLTSSSYVVLSLVERLQPVTAYDLKAVANSSVLNFWALTHTVLYTETKRLAAAGMLEAEQEPTGRRRRRFSLTPEGRDALDAWRSEPTGEFLELRDPGLLRLFAGGDPRRLGTLQRDRHRAQLADYERLAATLADDPSDTALRSTLAVGLAIEQAYVRFWTAIAEHGSVDPTLEEHGGAPNRGDAGPDDAEDAGSRARVDAASRAAADAGSRAPADAGPAPR